jgi:hypothetical protein
MLPVQAGQMLICDSRKIRCRVKWESKRDFSFQDDIAQVFSDEWVLGMVVHEVVIMHKIVNQLNNQRQTKTY